MHLAVDVRMRESGGIGTYLNNLLPLIEPRVEKLTLVDVASPIYSASEQVSLPRAIPQCDVFWSPHFTIPFLPIRAKKRVVTIHDVYHLDRGIEFSFAKRMVAKMLMGGAVKRSDQIITVSEFSKERLVRYFADAEEKLHVIHSGADHLNVQDGAAVEGVEGPFFLFVGNLKPHKNISLICQAMEHLPDARVVVAGKVGGFLHGLDPEELLERYPRVRGRLYFVGKVSDAQLVWLYDHAKALVFPSLYEGWGLPLLEAMGRGCPVIGSTSASIPEAVDGAAYLVDPADASGLARRMATIDRSLVEKGKKRNAQFTWQRCAEAHLALFVRRCHRAV